MPRIVRKKESVLSPKPLLWWGGIVLVLLLGFGISYVLGKSDSGAIDINNKINSVDQSKSEVFVNSNTTANQPNGGLRPQSQDTDGTLAPTAPEPIPEAPAETASSSEEATTTPTDMPTSTESADAISPEQETAE